MPINWTIERTVANRVEKWQKIDDERIQLIKYAMNLIEHKIGKFPFRSARGSIQPHCHIQTHDISQFPLVSESVCV